MNNIERRDAQIAYRADGEVFQEMQVCKGILQKLNTVDRADVEAVAAIVKELLGKSEGAFINPPFYCDYGSHIEVGKIKPPADRRRGQWKNASHSIAPRQERQRRS